MAFQQKSLLGYNRVSQSQLQVALTFQENILQSLLEVQPLTQGAIHVVDYGCSEGLNSVLTFKPVFQKFRQESLQEIAILHTDLPENNWSAVYSTINNQEISYVSLPNIFFSTIGRSFFNQLAPNNSVHLGYTSYAMHYLSKKQQRTAEDFGWAFDNVKTQGFQDLRHLLNLRIDELAVGGVFILIINAREEKNKDPTFSKYNFATVKRLLDRGIIKDSEFKNYIWHSYPYHRDELLEIFDGFSDRIEVSKCEYGKIPFPYYADYLEDRDLEKYKKSMTDMMRVMMKNNLFSALEREESEKADILELALKEIEKMLDEEISELYQDYLIAIFKKIR